MVFDQDQTIKINLSSWIGILQVDDHLPMTDTLDRSAIILVNSNYDCVATESVGLRWLWWFCKLKSVSRRDTGSIVEWCIVWCIQQQNGWWTSQTTAKTQTHADNCDVYLTLLSNPYFGIDTLLYSSCSQNFQQQAALPMTSPQPLMICWLHLESPVSLWWVFLLVQSMSSLSDWRSEPWAAGLASFSPAPVQRLRTHMRWGETPLETPLKPMRPHWSLGCHRNTMHWSLGVKSGSILSFYPVIANGRGASSITHIIHKTTRN